MESSNSKYLAGSFLVATKNHFCYVRTKSPISQALLPIECTCTYLE